MNLLGSTSFGPPSLPQEEFLGRYPEVDFCRVVNSKVKVVKTAAEAIAITNITSDINKMPIINFIFYSSVI